MRGIVASEINSTLEILMKFYWIIILIGIVGWDMLMFMSESNNINLLALIEKIVKTLFTFGKPTSTAELNSIIDTTLKLSPTSKIVVMQNISASKLFIPVMLGIINIAKFVLFVKLWADILTIVWRWYSVFI